MIFRRPLLLLVSLAGLVPAFQASAQEEDAPLSPTPLMANETRIVLSLLEQVHYLNAPVTESEFQKLITEFMTTWDQQRLFFTAADEKFFHENIGPVLSATIREQGNLQPAFQMFSVYRDRTSDRISWVLEELNKDFDFASNETYRMDRSEAAWPETSAEADELWRKRLKFELIPDLLNEKTIEEAREIVAKRYKRMLKDISEITPDEIEESFLTTLTHMYDPHSTYLSAETLEDFSIQMRLSLVGIGALLSSEDGYCVIKELIPGGPAILSNALHPNDKIVAVAQGNDEEPVDVVGMKLRKVVNLIRGEKGTTLVLTINPGDSGDDSVRRKVTLVRDVVRLSERASKASIQEVPQADGSLLPIGVIEIPSFYGSMGSDMADGEAPTSVTADVEELLGKLKKAGVRGVILDLRNNGGGLLEEAVELTGLFIKTGPVVQVKDHDGHVDSRPDTDAKIAYAGPLMVLTSRYSASASEIVAGALQNYGRAIIIGDSSTHGKGTVQAVLEMRNFIAGSMFENGHAGAAKLTTQKFYLPNGFSTQRKGVVPDVVIPSIDDFLAVGEADLPNALPWDTIYPLRFNGRELDDSLVNFMNRETSLRMSALDEFSFNNDRIEWFRKLEEIKDISLNLDARREKKNSEEAFRDQMKARQNSLAESNYSSTEVLLDSVENSDSDTPTFDDLVGEEDEDEDPVAEFDIPLREALRVLRDVINVAPDPQDWIRRSQIFASVDAAGGPEVQNQN